LDGYTAGAIIGIHTSHSFVVDVLDQWYIYDMFASMLIADVQPYICASSFEFDAHNRMYVHKKLVYAYQFVLLMDLQKAIGARPWIESAVLHKALELGYRPQQKQSRSMANEQAH
jgi:hypothetical protein